MELFTVKTEDVQTYARQHDFAMKILAALVAREGGEVRIDHTEIGAARGVTMSWGDAPAGRGIVVRTECA